MSSGRPSIPLNVQNSFLAQAVTLLDGISTYQAYKSLNSRKRKKLCQDKTRSKKRKDETTQTADVHVSKQNDAPSDATDMDMDPPSILRHLTVGINQVGTKLDTQIKSWRFAPPNGSETQEPAATNSSQPITIIFVCRADVNPPILIAHLPHLVAAYNTSILSRPSLKNFDLIKLVPLPKGAEFTLAEALGLRRAAVLALDVRSLFICSSLSLAQIHNSERHSWRSFVQLSS
jgi:ribonuclease P/MRP protein subunit POP3